jgi:hypothetical protein
MLMPLPAAAGGANSSVMALSYSGGASLYVQEQRQQQGTWQTAGTHGGEPADGKHEGSSGRRTAASMYAQRYCRAAGTAKHVQALLCAVC